MNGTKEVALVAKDEALPDEATTSMFERLARDPSVDVDKLERLVQMHERAAARIAQERFNAAMSMAQKAMRPIAADADNPQTRSRYASYAALDRALRPIYTEHGFAVSFDTGDAPGPQTVRMLAYVTHVGGFSRTYRADMPADGKGAKGGDVMTLTHATGAAMAYGMRYLLKMIFNVAVGEEDRDGNVPKEPDPTPKGFAEWWENIGDVVPEGIDRYFDVWKTSKPDFKAYALANHRVEHEARKVKALKVGQA